MMTDALIGREIDGYLIEALLGQGGMARVYRARDVRIGRYVAIKVIEPDVNADPEYTARFEKEARAVGQLDHPNIVRIYRFGEVDNLHYMAMQYVDGADLGWVMSDYAAENELLPLDDAARIVSQIGSALDYAHRQGVIHRDIKPSNVLLDKNGKAILTDFGLVLLQTEGTHGEIFGTPQYIAPEQAINSAAVVPQSDIYALGVIVYEMLTGHVPFDQGSSMDIAMAHVSEPPPPPLSFNPNLHPAFLPVLDIALKKEPHERYQSGAELAAALAGAVNVAQASQQPTKPASVRVSMLEVPEKVDKFRADNPLPPLPAPPLASVPPTPAPLPTAARPLPPPPPVQQQYDAAPPIPPAPPAPAYLPPQQPTTAVSASPRRRQKNQTGIWLLVGVGSGLILLAGVIAVIALVLLKNAPQGTPTPDIIALSAAATQVGAVSSQTPTLLPIPSTLQPTPLQFNPLPTPIQTATPLFAPTLFIPSPTPAPTLTPYPSLTPTPHHRPTATPTSVQSSTTTIILRIQAKGGDSLYIQNQTPNVALSLAGLELRSHQGSVSGADWNVALLQTSECVRILRRDNAEAVPDNMTCSNIVGDAIIRQGNDRFWRTQAGATFDIVYDGQVMDTCATQQVAHAPGCNVRVEAPTS